ncbi:hypothetical protein [Acidovorax sp.]|uniref:hypothetical protein n=1 Tax=Acidovorax sp. TaxID=1872122 RepID=UPI00391EEB4A
MWLYDGLPDDLRLSVRDATTAEGGYVVVLELQNSEIRLLATRYPAKYMTSWKSRTKQYAGSEVTRVLVSDPHPLYERVKRELLERLESNAESLSASKQMERIKELAKPIFSIKAATPNPDSFKPVLQFAPSQNAARTVWARNS